MTKTWALALHFTNTLAFCALFTCGCAGLNNNNQSAASDRAASATAVAESQNAPAAPPAASAPSESFDLYLLIGQSNMAGRGVVEDQDKKSHPRVFTLDKENQWIPAVDPIHFDKPAAGVGPGLSFGKIIAETRPNAKIGLIPCACGGTQIKAWLKNAEPDKTFGPIYANTLERARAAMKNGQIKGILWHQGSSDAKNTGTYRAKLVQLVNDLRGDLVAPHAPFIAGLQPEWKNDPGIAKINQATIDAARDLENYAVVTTTGLGARKDDPIHLDSPSARELGRRYALAVRALSSCSYDAETSTILAARSPRCIAVSNAAGRFVMVDVKAKPSDAEWKSRETVALDNVPGAMDLGPVAMTPYGGRLDNKTKATGFFYVARIDSRWRLVDPDGGLFLTMGVNSVKPLISNEGKAIAQRIFGTPERWMCESISLLRNYGFNTLACWSDWRTARPLSTRMPYTAEWFFMNSYGEKRGGTFQDSGHIGYPNGCIFIFDPEFEVFAEEYARQLAPLKEDPWLLGHFSDNELPLYVDLLDRFLQLPQNDNGYKGAKAWLDARLENNTDKTITDEDREAFVEHVVASYYRIVSNAIRKADPNHLYLGSRFHGAAVKQKAVFKGCAPYVDVVAVNLYRVWTPDNNLLDNWIRWSGRPFIVTEWYAKGMDSGLANVSGAGWVVKTQADRGLFYQNFTLPLLRHPGCVGWHWFRYQDNDPYDLTADPSNRDSNKGIVSVNFEPYVDLLRAMKAINDRAYSLIDRFQTANPPTGR